MSSTTLRLISGALFFVLVMSLPIGITAWFDGLPWTGGMETLAVIIIAPFLLILGYRFLSLRRPVIFLAALLFLKIVMFIGAPSSGWIVRAYPNLNDEQLYFFSGNHIGARPHAESEWANSHHIDNTNDFIEGWVKTYATTWNKNASGVLQEPWAEKLDFPLDWAVPLTPEIFDSLSPVFEIEGTLLLPEGRSFALVARGVAEGTLLATGEDGRSFVLSPAKSFEEAGQSQYQLPEGRSWRLSGKLKYAGDDWSLIPVLIEEDRSVNSKLGRDVLWQDESVLSRHPRTLKLYHYLSWVIDAALCLFFLAWVIWTGRCLVQKQFLTLSIAVLTIFAGCVPVFMAPVFAGLYKIINLSDPTHASYLGFSIIAAGMGFLIWTRWKNDFRNFQTDRIVISVFLLFGPAFLFFFAHLEFVLIGKWYVLGTAEDWVAYQQYARKIAVRGEWLSGGESSLMGREFYPYVIAILHWLFGKSQFAQNLVNVWSVLGAATILASLAIRLRTSTFLAFIISAAYLLINLIGAFRYHIFKSLPENTAMIFMMLAAWYWSRARKGGMNRIVLATIFGILGYWTRQDHLGAIFALAFLALEPEGSTGGWKGYWDRFKLYWKPITWYWGAGILSILLLCFRNWLMGAGFVLAHMESGTSGLHKIFTAPISYYLIITGNDWPAFPSIAGFVVTIGVFAALLALVWRPKVLLNFPLSLGVIIACLLVPYLFAMSGGYPPRFSIHLLPLALLSFMILINNVFNYLRFSSRNI